MADDLISVTIQVTLETALPLAAGVNDLLFGFKDNLADITKSIHHIRAVLPDAEGRQVWDREVHKWLKNLEGVAFDVYTVLDLLNFHFLRHKAKSRNQLKRKVCFFFSSNSNITFLWRMASKVRDIKIMLNNINKEADKLGLIAGFATITAFPAAAAGDATIRQTDSLAVPTIGRANDESKIVKLLLSQSEKIISVIPITGMAGLGKTTLAKSIYNKKEINGHFHKKIWVCVSKEVQIVGLFKLILEQLTREKVEVDDRNVIVQKLRELLGEKRYFLVLDDVWNHERGFWNDFFITLKGLNPTSGSWCLVTTRLKKLAYTVSMRMDAIPYPLGRLPEDDCWSILKEKAIGEGEEPEELKAIRGKVLKRCDGLPLAASVMGDLLYLSAKEEWSSIVEKNLLSGDQSGVQEKLKLSFDYLSPASVKKCFAYCSIFPRDTEMERDSMIELWMAEGFLVPGLDNGTVMENIGGKYLSILLQSSLFEEIRDYRGVRYKMHDLVHDFAESISNAKSINLEAGVMDNNFQVRYLPVNSALEKNHFENVSTSIRTLFLNSDMLSGEMLVKFKNLHVLNLSDAETMGEVPTTIDKLIHLRYLDLSHSKIQALPESLCKLYNLQTLRLIRCRFLEGLPKGMSNLISLRHLHYYTDNAGFKMPLEMQRLTCLQTLEFFNVDQEEGRGIEELGYLKNLKGKLEIRNLELVKGKEGAEKADLIGKQDLFRLELLWSSTNREGDNSSDKNVLEGLQPHSNLQELVIQNFMGHQFPKWFMDLRLVNLELRNCNRCRELPSTLGICTTLSNLRIDGMTELIAASDSVAAVGLLNNNTMFQNLKNLSLRRCPNLTSISGWCGTCLESLDLIDCENLRVFPEDLFESWSLRRLHIEECPRIIIPEGWLPIKHYMGDQFPQWFIRLSELVDLELTNCRELPVALGRLPFLQHLKLRKLESITNIGLSFYGIDNHSSNSSSRGVPRTTTFFPALKTLYLEEMKNLVEWMGAEEEVRSTTTTTGGGGESFEEVLDVCFPVLESLIIEDCSKLTIAPSHFSNLKELEIWGNKHVSLLKSILLSKGISTTLSTLRVHGERYGCDVSDIEAAGAGLLDNKTATIFQNLKDVSFQHYPYLTSISGSVCPCLESLELYNCENLSGELPHLFEFQSLRELRIFYCPRIVIIPEALPKLTSLGSLWIVGSDELTNLPLKMPKSLQWLHVGNCPNLVSFPLDLQQTPSLVHFQLTECPKLKIDMTPKGFGFLTRLEFLSIGPFSDDENSYSSVYNEFDWSGLQSSSTLWKLELYGLPHMESLPHQLQYLTTLTSLELNDFGGIEALPDWIGNLQSLQRLSLFSCEKLRFLPSMDAMTRLTKLTYLGVLNCPLLKERCSQSYLTDSSERSKIAHISHCYFD